MALVSYAQNNEDVLLNRVFGGRQIGFYIDVGAYHPVEGSVTKLFYDRGWSGINVEPGSVFDVLSAQRPRDVNLRMAVLDRKGEVAFLEMAADRGMSHVIEHDAECSVPCDTLEAIVAVHGMGRPIDFIKIDAEGSEAAIVRSTDWRRLRPSVLLIEATKPWSSILTNKDWEPDLLSAGYLRAYFDGINCFYVPEEEWPVLERHFQAPVNALDSVIAHGHAAALAELAIARQTLADTQGELATSRQTLADTQGELATSRQTLADTQGELAAAQQALAGTRAELSGLREANDQAARAAAALREELERVRAELVQELEQPVDALQTAPPLSGSPPARTSLRRALRGMARFLYGFVRPIVRPIAWRTRAFLTTPTLLEITNIAGQLRHLDERLAALGRDAASWAHLQPVPQDAGAVDVIAGAELRRLAGTVQDAVLTLAMEASCRSSTNDLQSEPDDPTNSIRS